MNFGDYTPDIQDRDNPGLTVAKNCFPGSTSYRQVLAPVAYSGALDARCQGFRASRDSSGNVHNYAGDASKLYILSSGGTAWASAGTGYSCPAAAQWEFVDWGDNVIAVQAGDAPQIDTIGTGTFAALSGSPPTSRHVGVVRDFVVLGNFVANPNRIHWSAINDETGWTAGTNQSDIQDFPSGGAVQRIIGGEYGVIFLERSIYRLTYVGYPLVFQVDEVEPGRGTPAPWSVVQFGDIIYYLGHDGFYAFDGQQSHNIGSRSDVSLVDKTFYEDLDVNYYDRISAGIDPINSLVFWSYPASGSNGTPNKIIIYNWITGKWAGPVEITHEILASSYTIGYSLDELTTVLGYTNIDTLPFSLDSGVWQGGQARLSTFDANHKLTFFTGDPLEACFETGEGNINPGGRALVTGVRPLFDGDGTAMVEIGSRNSVNGTVTWSAPSSQNAQTGICGQRVNAYYHRVRVTITGGFDHAYGYEAIAKQAGKK